MGSIHRIVALLSLTCLLVLLIDDVEGAGAPARFRIIRRGRRTGTVGGYGGGSDDTVSVSASPPEPPALYSAPKASEEQTQNEVTSDQAGTTTELSSSEEQPQSEDVGVSEDYLLSTATQMSAVVGQPDSTEASQEGEMDKGERRSSEITAGPGGYDYPKTSDEKSGEDLERSNEIMTSGQGSSYYKARDQVQVENQDHFQAQTQAPSPVQEPKASYEQIAAIHQPTTSYIPQPERQDYPNARQYDQPTGGYGGRTEIPQARNVPQQQPAQLYQQPQQPQQLYQQPQQSPPSQPQQPQQSYPTQPLYQQQPQQVYQQPQQYYPPPQQQPEQFHQQQQQQRTSEQTPEPTSYYSPAQYQQRNQHAQYQQQRQQQPQAYQQPQQSYQQQQPQQSSYQPQSSYQQPEPQPQYGPQNQQQQQQQQQFNVQGQPRALYQNQPSERYAGDQANSLDAPVPKIDTDSPSTLEGLNDNVVDAELLERVQQIIEEHERKQKEFLLQQRLRNSQRQETPKDNEVFSGTRNEFQQPNIYSGTNENSNQNAIAINGNSGNPGYPRPTPPNVYYGNIQESRTNEEPPQPPQQRPELSSNPAQLGRSIPQSYFQQEQQAGYPVNAQNGPVENPQNPRQGYARAEENRGRALTENKNIDFQPAVLTSHFTQSSSNQGQRQGQNGGGYLPAPQQNIQSYQQQQPSGGQNGYSQNQQQQQHADVGSSPRGIQPAFQVSQPQQPENYFIHQQQQQPQVQYIQPATGGYPNYQPQPQVEAQQILVAQPSPEPERRDVGDPQENSLEYYQKQGGYPQAQQVYYVPQQQYQQQQEQYDDTNVVHAAPETPNIITRTIVIHEQPTTAYHADNNRAIITAADLRGGAPSYQPQQYPQQIAYQEPQPQQIPQIAYQEPQQNPQIIYQEPQQQQYQYLTATAQLSLAPEHQEPSSPPTPVYSQPQQLTSNSVNEIVPPKPIYGIPLAPVLGPNDSLEPSNYQTQKPSYLPPEARANAGNYEVSSTSTTQGVPTWDPAGGYDSTAQGSSDNHGANSPVPLVSNTVSLPTREYFPSSEPTSDQTTPESLPYGRRIDRNLKKRFSTAVTSPLAGFFSVKSKTS